MTPSAARAIQTFEVSLKAFVVRDGRALLLREADTGYWELPGGRIDVGEEHLAHATILQRELVEELGPDFSVSEGLEMVSWVRQRPTDRVFQFLLARMCWYSGGDIVLSPEHTAHMWATPDDWAALEFPPLSEYPEGLMRLWNLTLRRTSDRS
jgi:8-oxo-dGTP pyrophosphatase MutT (NUDIX family)